MDKRRNIGNFGERVKEIIVSTLYTTLLLVVKSQTSMNPKRLS